jgi:hypothetical protein
MEKKIYRVPVYGDVDWHSDVIARVKFNTNLDYWDGHNWTDGGIGTHSGLTKLRDGRYVLIHGSELEGTRDYGEIISAKEALNRILASGNEALLETEKFAELRKLAEELPQEEEEED